MKKLISTCLFTVITISYTLAYLPIGYATCNGGTTGGGDATPITVSTLAEFKSTLSANAKNKVVYIDGTIKMDGCYSVDGWENITIYGLPGATLEAKGYAKDENGILYLKNARNIIIQNLTFKGKGAYDCDGRDNLCIDNCTNIWVDHCDFQDGTDGNFDIIHQSDYVAVTYCIFQYKLDPISGGSGGSDDHRYTNLIGNSDSNTEDKGTLRVTYQYCWWAEGCVERMPRVRFGQVHLVNNLFTSSVGKYCVRAAYQSDVYVDKNAFIGVKNPVTNNSSQDFNCTFTDNYTSGTSGTDTADKIQALGGCSGAATNPYSNYCEAISTIDASEVEAKVKENAGAILTSNEPEIGGNLPTLEYTGSIDQTVTKGSDITPITFIAGATAINITVSNLPQGLASVVEGLTLNISGTPTESGTYTVTATNDADETVSISGTITVNEPSQVSDFWNFSDDIFKNIGNPIDDNEVTINGLTLIKGSKSIGVIEASGSYDGYNFTHALSYSGGGSTNSCVVKFDVSGNCTVTVYAVSGNTAEERTLRLATETEKIQDNTVSNIAKLTYNYTGEATTLYLFSAGSGIRVFGIKLSYPLSTDGAVTQTAPSIRYLNGKIQNPENENIILYNISGQCIEYAHGDIDMNTYPTGIYIIRTSKGECIKIMHRK